MDSRRVPAILFGVLLVTTVLPVSDASHDDGSYDLPVWFKWNGGRLEGRTELDIVIVPPSHGQVFNGNGALGSCNPLTGGPCGPSNANELTPLNSYLAATVDSVQAWADAIQQFGPAWLQGLQFNVYVLGQDTPPAYDLLFPEVLIVSDESKAVILGVAIQWGLGPECIVDNSKFFITSFTYADMFNINGQEFGHCLGLNHVVSNHPVNDVMNGSYPYSPGNKNNPLNCPSNLDVVTLELVFASVFGQPAGGFTGTMPVGSYQQVQCGS